MEGEEGREKERERERKIDRERERERERVEYASKLYGIIVSHCGQFQDKEGGNFPQPAYTHRHKTDTYKYIQKRTDTQGSGIRGLQQHMLT